MLHISNTFLGECAHGDDLDATYAALGGVLEGLDEGPVFRVNTLWPSHVNLIHCDHDWFAHKEWLDAAEQTHLKFV